jgi:hypothetical protein
MTPEERLKWLKLLTRPCDHVPRHYKKVVCEEWALVTIEEALVEQRERDAKIATEWAERAEGHEMYPAYGLNAIADTANGIADAIRKETP